MHFKMCVLRKKNGFSLLFTQVVKKINKTQITAEIGQKRIEQGTPVSIPTYKRNYIPNSPTTKFAVPEML